MRGPKKNERIFGISNNLLEFSFYQEQPFYFAFIQLIFFYSYIIIAKIMADKDETKKDDTATAEELAAKAQEEAEKEEEFLRKWSGALLIGPFIPAVFATFTIVIGSIILSMQTGDCGYPLESFVQIAVVLCYLFLLVYTWVFLGDRIIVKVPFTTKEVCLLAPYTNLKWLMWVYAVLFVTSFIVWIVGSAMLQLSRFCAVTQPLVYSFTVYLVTVYWIGFCIVSIMIFKMKYGKFVMDQLAEQMREPTEAELEEKIFRKKFNEYDKDKTGVLPRESLPTFLQALLCAHPNCSVDSSVLFCFRLKFSADECILTKLRS